MSDPIRSILDDSAEAQRIWYAMFTKFSAYVPWLSHGSLTLPTFPVLCIDPRPDCDGDVSFTSAREYFDVLEGSLPRVIRETERFVERYDPQ